MKTSVKWIAIALSMVVLIGGAYFLYNKLSNDQANNDSNGGFVIVMSTNSESTDKGSSTPTDTNTPSTPDTSGTSSEAQTTASSQTQQESESVSTTEQISEPTNPAPDFTVVDINGNEVKLSDMRGKPVVVNFWASWCPPCKAEMPDFESVYKKYGDNVVFMMVNMTDGYQETLSKAKAHISQNGYTFPVYFDTMSSAAYSYNITSIPATYLIDDKGNLVGYKNGMLTAEALEEAIALIYN